MTTALARLRAVAAKRKIVSITAWDFPSGLLAETAGMDLVLVGDSLGMAALGYKDTKAVTLDEMVHHTRAVTRAVKAAFVLADLPLGSYEKSTEHGKFPNLTTRFCSTNHYTAIDSAIRLIKEGGADGVKLEGGVEMSQTIRAISNSGIPVIGHIGTTLQRGLDTSNHGAESEDADAGILADAHSVQDAGAVAMVVSSVSSQTAARITNALRIPTIGIG